MRRFELGRRYYKMLKPEFVWALIRRDGGKSFEVGDLTLDHVQPKFRGGAKMDIDNMQMLCADCHERKNHKDGSIPSRPCTANDKAKKKLNPKSASLFVPDIKKFRK